MSKNLWSMSTFFFIILLPLGALGMTEEPSLSHQAPGMPVSRVVLFTSGVAYVEHAETVRGETSRQLSFPTEGMDDLLKSLVIRDLDGGRVGTVTYGAQEPISRQLQKLTVDLSDDPSMEELLRRIRGSEVRLLTDGGAVEGFLFGVERRPEEGKERPGLYVNLLEGRELTSHALTTLTALELKDRELQRDLQNALALLREGRNDNHRSVTFAFHGEGERRIRLAYVREAPVWKLSYRLALEEEEAILQGWAIIENTGSQPWKSVELSLVSGAPRSFVMELFAPQYIRRPRISASPASGKLSEPPPPAASRRSAAVAETEAAPTFGEMADTAFDAGVESAAEARERGEFVEYAVPLPVTMASGEAAMLPVVQEPVTVRRLAIFEDGAGVNPFHAVEVENTTGLLLQAGAVTVFAAGSYGGDAIMPTLAAGERETLRYARDLETEVVRSSRRGPEEITAIEADRGTLIVRRSLRRSATYELTTSDREGRTVRVESPREENWVLQSPTPSGESSESYYFDVVLEAGEKRELTVAEERVLSQSVAIRSLSPETVAFYLRQGELLSPSLRSGLRELSRAQERLAEVRREMRAIEGEIEGIYNAQERIRQNMGVLDRESSLYERYLAQLGSQEDALERLEERRGELRREEAAAESEVEELIRSLSRL